MTDTTAGEGDHVAEARRALKCLRLEVAPSIADDIERRVELAFTALAAQPSAGAQAWAGYCRLCGTARKVSPCHKCSVPLSPLMADHEEPDMPDIEKIRTLAAEVGYAIGVHGSMERDLDVIAAPWVETAVSAPELAAHLAKGLNARLLNDKVQDKPCGRWSCCIQIDGWFKHIDLSVCAATPAQPDTGYTDAFYQLAEMMGLPASPQSPRTVWETVMRPRLQDLLAQPDTGDVLAGESYFETGADGEWKVRRPASTFDDLIADLHRRADSCHDLNKPDQTEHARGRLHGKEGAYRHAANMVRELKALSALRQPDTGDVAALREALEPFIDAMKVIRPDDHDTSKICLATVGDYRRLAAAYAALSKPNAPGAA